MQNFWDFSVWGGIHLVAVLLLSLLTANMIKRSVPFLRNSLIPTSVLGGILLLLLSIAYKAITGNVLFDTAFFGGNGMQTLEIITYHALALGFIATSYKPAREKLTGKRRAEIFNTGVTTVSMYLLQGVFGMAITIVAAMFIKGFFPAAGILLPFGFGQGTGQALNYGNLYELDYGFIGGKSFGLTIAALGFLSASLGGVIHLNILKKKNKIIHRGSEHSDALGMDDVQGDDEIPMNGSMDKISVQMAWVFAAYFLTYLVMYGLGNLVPGLRSVLYGFNFLIGVLIATLISSCVTVLRRRGIVHRQYVNTFLMQRIGGFFFDIMVIAGIAAIRLDVLENYWGIMLVLGAVGLVITYFYNLYVARKLFSEYAEEQFLAMYGMLTGTASTGIILLRELDPNYETPVADNLVYQNVPAIVFGFPMMLLAALAPKQPILTLIILAAFFVVMQIILFRRAIFQRGKK
ncbi:MAG: hypothetical protein IKB87_04435 [Clostridia bacterium]|nr:hypothetical protein [Clostridia bacterium]